MTSIAFRFCKTNPQNRVCSQSPFHSLTARSVVPQSVAVELSVIATTRLSERIARKMRVCLTGVTFDEGGAVKILFASPFLCTAASPTHLATRTLV